MASMPGGVTEVIRKDELLGHLIYTTKATDKATLAVDVTFAPVDED